MDEILPSGPLSDLILTVAKKLLNHPNSKATLLKRDWQRAVGERLAKHTEPVKLQNGQLTVRVDSSAWLTELTFLSPEILQKLQTIFTPERLKEIRFKQESLRTIPKWMQEKPPLPQLPPPVPAEEAKAAALTIVLTDPALKEAMTRFFTTDMVLKRTQSTSSGSR